MVARAYVEEEGRGVSRQCIDKAERGKKGRRKVERGDQGQASCSISSMRSGI